MSKVIENQLAALEEAATRHGAHQVAISPCAALELIAHIRMQAEEIANYQRLVPECTIETQNPISQVYFRAGLLACREYMARFVEPENATIAASIRANWWPLLGDDPGVPRKFDFAELAEERHDGSFAAKQISPSVEALPIALGFIGERAAP